MFTVFHLSLVSGGATELFWSKHLLAIWQIALRNELAKRKVYPHLATGELEFLHLTCTSQKMKLHVAATQKTTNVISP